MIQQAMEILHYTQYSEVLGWILLMINALFSALFSEILAQKVFSRKRLMIFKFLGICILVYIGFTAGTLLLLWGLLHIFPQKENFAILLKRTGELHAKEFLIPLATTLIAGWAISGKWRQRKRGNIILCMLLVISTFLSSIMFFWNSFLTVQRPRYVAPVESISSIINSRLSVYPLY